MFNITEHIEFDPKGRAVCPFCFSEGKTGKNLSLIPNTDGAYKCHRGCTPDQIRAALNQPKDQQIPAALAKPPAAAPNVLVQLAKVTEAHELLLRSAEPLQWLLDKRLEMGLIHHYQLGLARSKCGETHLPSISIPIPSDIDDGTFYQKKRVAPWLSKEEQPKGYKRWSQYGIPTKVWFTHECKDPEETWILAGEWDAMLMGYLLKDQASIAICTFTTGETNIPKDKAELAKLQGNLIVFYDLDAAGIKGAEKVQATFPDRCRIAAVPAPPDAKEGYDVSDSLNGGFTLTDFFEAVQSARTYKPPKKENPVRNKIVTNRELFDRAPDHVDFLVPDLLTEDELFVIAGPPRGGKSLLCMNLAKAIAEGGKFLDRPVMQGSVLYVNCEDSEAKVKERQIAQNWDPDSPVYWLNRFKLSELEHLIEVAKEIDDLRLIILDTLSRVRDDNCNESSADLSRVLEPLQEFAQEQKVCIIITHHTSKMTAEDLLDPFASIRGSGAIRATCRGAIVIAPGDNCYRLISENGHTEKLDIKIRCDINNLEWKLMGRWQPRIASESVRDRVLDHLNLVGESTIDRISQDLQIASNTVKITLWRLLADDLVTKRGGVKGSPALYSRGVHKVTVTESEPNCNADTLSAIGYKVTNNITNTPSEKVIIEPKVIIEERSLFAQRSLLKDEPLAHKGVTERENLDAVRDTFGYVPESCNRIELDATVIIQEGRFYGLHAKVMAIDPDGLVEVKAENWSISRKYPIDQLKLVIDRGGDQ
jgi:hypothetical protein